MSLPVMVIVDAVAPSGNPGRIHVRRLGEAGWSAGSRRTDAGSHGFDVAEVAAQARALGHAHGDVVVVGIEGASFAPGSPLSPVVTRNLEAAVRAVTDLAREPA